MQTTTHSFLLRLYSGQDDWQFKGRGANRLTPNVTSRLARGGEGLHSALMRFEQGGALSSSVGRLLDGMESCVGICSARRPGTRLPTPKGAASQFDALSKSARELSSMWLLCP